MKQYRVDVSIMDYFRREVDSVLVPPVPDIPSDRVLCTSRGVKIRNWAAAVIIVAAFGLMLTTAGRGSDLSVVLDRILDPREIHSAVMSFLRAAGN